LHAEIHTIALYAVSGVVLAIVVATRPGRAIRSLEPWAVTKAISPFAILALLESLSLNANGHLVAEWLVPGVACLGATLIGRRANFVRWAHPGLVVAAVLLWLDGGWLLTHGYVTRPTAFTSGKKFESSWYTPLTGLRRVASDGRDPGLAIVVPASQATPISAEEPQMRGQHTSKPGSEDTERLQATVVGLRPGVVLLGTRRLAGNDSYECLGSGFVVSAKRRLIATAAHAADYSSGEYELVAVTDGSAVVYPVRHVWYHPGLRRELGHGLIARSDNPLDGDPADGCPDVALLQLADGGPELRVQLELARQPELENLQGQRVGFLGFPAGKGNRWPTPSRPAAADFSSCVIERMLDAARNGNQSARTDERQFLWCSASSGPGNSGSPLFLPNGHVVGIVTHGGPSGLPAGAYRDLGFRIDCLRELLTYHRLDDSKISSARAEALRSDWGPDPQLGDFREAVKLVRAAADLQTSGKLRESQMKCDEALALAPRYGEALFQRGNLLLFFLSTNPAGVSPEEKLAYAKSALADSDRCAGLYPLWNPAYLLRLECEVYVARLTSNRETFQNTIKHADDLLKRGYDYRPLTPLERSFAINVRGQCHFFLDEMAAAEADFNLSISLAPEMPDWFGNRARYWDHEKKPELAEADRRRAQALRSDAGAASVRTLSRPALPSAPNPGTETGTRPDSGP
jgi:tetratricopeptide (TPR) repeat protein